MYSLIDPFSYSKWSRFPDISEISYDYLIRGLLCSFSKLIRRFCNSSERFGNHLCTGEVVSISVRLHFPLSLSVELIFQLV